MFIWCLLSDKMTTFSNISENGEWKTWDKWSPCSVTCGKGHMYRSRRCSYPNLPGDDISCNSNAMESRECTSNDCAGTYKKQNITVLCNQLVNVPIIKTPCHAYVTINGLFTLY